jgi:GAF domain-containing protein
VQAIAEGVSAATGEAFFRSLMQYLAKTLAADYAFVGEMSPEHSHLIRTVAVCADGQIAPNFSYELRHTPCQQVTSGTLCVYPDRIQSRFPHDRGLAEMGIEGYVGTPLCDSQERVIGLMVMLSRRPLEHPQLCVSTLRIFATRAAAELERKQAEEAVRASETRWLTNVLRHAHATRVDVTLEADGAALVLKVRDNGRGITEGELGGPLALGLLGMRERAHLIGSSVDITGSRGQGTMVTVRVPHARD